MVRTQIYLSREERTGLQAVSRLTGKKQSELIRDAVDRFLEAAGEEHRKAALQEAAGIWRNRRDMPDFAKVRKSLDRQ